MRSRQVRAASVGNDKIPGTTDRPLTIWGTETQVQMVLQMVAEIQARPDDRPPRPLRTQPGAATYAPPPSSRIPAAAVRRAPCHVRAATGAIGYPGYAPPHPDTRHTRRRRPSTAPPPRPVRATSSTATGLWLVALPPQDAGAADAAAQYAAYYAQYGQPAQAEPSPYAYPPQPPAYQ